MQLPLSVTVSAHPMASATISIETECRWAEQYKAMYPPRCSIDGAPCTVCQRKWDKRALQRAVEDAFLTPVIEHAAKLLFELVLKDDLMGPYGRPMP